MTRQADILRLKDLGHSKSAVALALGINRETVARYWNGSPPEPSLSPPKWVQEIDWNYLQEEIKKNVSKKVLYEELQHITELPSYQAFCEYLSRHIKTTDPEITVKIQRIAGDSIEVDYAGDTVEILNPATGEIYRASLFIGALSYSGYFYGEFTLSQKLEDFIDCHKNMFTFFGGVAKYIIPDNCKTAVGKADFYDPQINNTYLDMCKHYGIVVDPADPASPKHKPNVERSVGIVEGDYFHRIRNKTFTSLTELNEDFKRWLLEKLKDEIRGRGQSREYFFQIERKELRPLPNIPYQLFYFKKAKVHPDCHFMHEKNYYSVPFQYVGKEIDLKFNSKEIHAYHEINLIASHATFKGHYHYSTNEAHYPEKKIVDANYHLAQAKKNAEKIGPNTLQLIERLIREERFPLKTLRKVQGILDLEKKFKNEALEYASEMCLEFDCMNRDRVQRFARGYREKKEETTEAPERQLEFICLQGGLSD